ncbi:MAG: DUF2092 domain-containing protein [Pseudomonadota bacterium]
MMRPPFLLFLSAAFLIGLGPQTSASADDDAKALLKAMSDYMAQQKDFSFAFESTMEAVTPDFQKLQFVSSGKASVSRPDKIHVTRTGGFADLDVTFDGKMLTVYGKNLGAYAQVEAKGSLEDLDDRLADAGVETPGGDLLGSNVYDTLMADVTDAKHIASAYVDGVECEYLAFRTPDSDWQIWIQAGDKPIPRRYVITSKHVVQAPQYTFELRDFKSGAEAGTASFTFDKPASAKQVDLSALDLIDELPAAADQGGAP